MALALNQRQTGYAGDKNAEAEARRQRAYEAALEEWRGTIAGEGHRGFFRFGAKLKAAGFSYPEIEQLLRQHYGDSQSNASDRRKQIPSIMASLQRSC